jgi:hypothetical protein
MIEIKKLYKDVRVYLEKLYLNQADFQKLKKDLDKMHVAISSGQNIIRQSAAAFKKYPELAHIYKNSGMPNEPKCFFIFWLILIVLAVVILLEYV